MSFRIEVMNEAEVAAAIRKAGLAPRAVLEAAVEAAAEVVRDAAVPNAPGPGIGKEKSEDTETVVSFHVGPDKAHWYYRFAETGAQAHQITPRVARALWIEGRFVAGARHPGMPAKPFLRPASDENKPAASAAAGKVIREALE